MGIILSSLLFFFQLQSAQASCSGQHGEDLKRCQQEDQQMRSAAFKNFGKTKDILVYGKGFSFTLQEPVGWHCECDGKLAAPIGANVALWRKTETFKTAEPLIYLRVLARGQSPQDDLAKDMTQAQLQNSELVFQDLTAPNMIGPNPQDLTAGKIFKIGAKAYEYVLYFYPAGSRLNALSITMHIDKREATPEELKVLKELVASIQWVADKVKLKKRK